MLFIVLTSILGINYGKMKECEKAAAKGDLYFGNQVVNRETSYNEEKKRYEAMVFECSREGFMRDEFIISKDVFDQLGGNDRLAWELIKSGEHLSYFENSIHGPDIERHYQE